MVTRLSRFAVVLVMVLAGQFAVTASPAQAANWVRGDTWWGIGVLEEGTIGWDTNYQTWYRRDRLHAVDFQHGPHQWGVIVTVNWYDHYGNWLDWDRCTAHHNIQYEFGWGVRECDAYTVNNAIYISKGVMYLCTWDSSQPGELAHWCDPDATRTLYYN